MDCEVFPEDKFPERSWIYLESLGGVGSSPKSPLLFPSRLKRLL